jgi:hypothetical protein
LKKNKDKLIKDYKEVIENSKCDLIVEPSQKDIYELQALFSLLNVTEYEFNQMRLISSLIEEETNKNQQDFTISREDNKKADTIIIDNKYKRQSVLSWVSSQGGEASDRYNNQFIQSEKFIISSRNFDIIFYYGGQMPSNNSKVSGCWIGFNSGFGSRNEIYKIKSELENSGVIPLGLTVYVTSGYGCVEAEIGATHYDK